MSKATCINWGDVGAAAKELAGNWRRFEAFVWDRRHVLEDADNWAVIYTSNRDSGLLAQSNESAINRALGKYTEGDDPDIVFETHTHWAVGHVSGFSIRVFKPDETITDAFREVCRLQERLDDYPVLDEEDYSERELDATLENYRNEIGHYRSDLPSGWEAEVYRSFSDKGEYRYIDNTDDQGGWAPREKLREALIDLGLLPDEGE